MKRLALLTVFFYVCTFAAPQRAQAVVPVALIAAAAVGTAMMSASAGTYYAQHGVLPQYVSSAASAVGSAADKIFQPSYLAMGAYSLLTPTNLTTAKDYYVGQGAAVGAKVGDIVDHVKSSASSSYTAFKALLAANTDTINPDHTGVSLRAIVAMSNGVNYKIVGGPSISAFAASGLSSIPSSYPYIALSGGAYAWRPSPTEVYMAIPGDFYHGVSSLLNLYMYTAAQANEPATLLPSTAVNYPGLKDALNPTVPGAVAAEIPKIIKNMPASQVAASTAIPSTAEAADGPPAITQADVNAAIKANTAAVAQAVAQAAADIAAANPDDAAAQIAAAQAALEAAKAAEEAAKEEPAEETFSPISDTAFAEPYNPGEFDIPARFTTFLNNVQSSGLFSFSNDFFNSLPGGGSPIFEIEGGMFGSHRIDLSETMNGGLAVLKTVFLALFGFLSIRAVIMKR